MLQEDLPELMEKFSDQDKQYLFKNKLIIDFFKTCNDQLENSRKGEKVLNLVFELKTLRDNHAPNINMGINFKPNSKEFKKVSNVLNQGY